MKSDQKHIELLSSGYLTSKTEVLQMPSAIEVNLSQVVTVFIDTNYKRQCVM